MADRWGGRVRRVLDGRLGLGRGSINVSAVRETDAGLYRCRVTFPNRTPPARNNGTFYYLEVDGQNPYTTYSARSGTYTRYPTAEGPIRHGYRSLFDGDWQHRPRRESITVVAMTTIPLF